MKYQVVILRKIQKDLLNLHPEVYKRITKILQSLVDNPKPAGALKLSGRDGLRIRIGDYRIIYEIDEVHNIVTILAIGHRSDIYD